MTYVVTDNCIACKYTDCVEVCPVDCFYEGENMLVIHPDECIDCGVCEPECPADAIRPDTEPDMEEWVAFNRKYAVAWPEIVTKKDPLPEPRNATARPASATSTSRKRPVRALIGAADLAGFRRRAPRVGDRAFLAGLRPGNGRHVPPRQLESG